jgi:methionyl-tRNA formyltransferase
MKNKITWAFFGTSHFSTLVLNELKAGGYIPSLIVTVEDKPKGRKLVLTPPEAKVWAEENHVPYVQLKALRTPESEELIRSFAPEGFDLFIVASYGKIIPQNILDIPKYKTLNVHPSLLPKLRGPSPMISAILTENETGVSIMRLDAEMDHGPILLQKTVPVEWPPYAEDLENTLGKVGGEMLVQVIEPWMRGEIKEIEQDHSKATLCQKIEKTDAEIDLSAPAETNLRKIRAYHLWPGAYFFDTNGGKKIRVIIKRARIDDGILILERVVPEGKKEMDYISYLNGKKS